MYSLVMNIGIFVVVASDSIQTYHVAISSYVAAGLALTSVAINYVIYSGFGSRQAAAAGFILLAMIDVRGLSCPNPQRFQLLTLFLLDSVDLLLWLYALVDAPCFRRLVCFDQRLDHEPPAHGRLWCHGPPRNLQLGPASANVHVGSAQRL